MADSPSNTPDATKARTLQTDNIKPDGYMATAEAAYQLNQSLDPGNSSGLPFVIVRRADLKVVLKATGEYLIRELEAGRADD